MNVLTIGFVDFRRHVKDLNKRIYYYISGNDSYFYFLIDGMLVKSYIDLSKLPDPKQFFSEEIFIGATKLLFNIVEDESRTIKGINPFITDVIQSSKTAEGENRDLQKEGAGDVI